MEKYKIEIEIEAETQEEAIEKLEAFQKITSTLDHEEFIITADFIEQNPNAIETIKSWIVNPPGIIKTAHKLLFKSA